MDLIWTTEGAFLQPYTDSIVWTLDGSFYTGEAELPPEPEPTGKRYSMFLVF